MRDYDRLYEGSFHCGICDEDLQFRIFGSEGVLPPEVLDRLVKETQEEAPWRHWNDSHRVCAKCGNYVRSEDLDLLLNDGKIAIHDAYTDNFKRVTSGDLGRGLIVHEHCLNAPIA